MRPRLLKRGRNHRRLIAISLVAVLASPQSAIAAVTVTDRPDRQDFASQSVFPGGDVSPIIPASHTSDTTTRVSESTTHGQGNGVSDDSYISADGRSVTYRSTSSNLVAGDTNGVMDVFVHDRLTETTSRASVDAAGVEGNAQSDDSAISADGHYVVFKSQASNFVTGDTNGTSWDIFRKDLQTGAIVRVSTSSAGAQSNGASHDPVISADGHYVAFRSSASNLVTGDTNGQQDIFRKDVQTGTTTLVSVSSAGVQGNALADDPQVSADGNRIAFHSDATNLVASDTNAARDVFVRDVSAGTTVRVSVSSSGTQGNGASAEASISGDGTTVAYQSDASNLVASDTNAKTDVFVHVLATGVMSRVSVSASGTQQTKASEEPSLSGDGAIIAFDSLGSSLVSGDTNSRKDIFIKDLATGTVTRMSVDDADVQGNDTSRNSSVSGDGTTVAFESDSTNLVASDTNGAQDVFVRGPGLGPPATPSTPDLTAASDSGVSTSDNVTTDTTPTFTGTADTGSTVTVSDGSTAVGSGVVLSGVWTVTTAALDAGTHAITAKASIGGMESSASGTTSLIVDGDDPQLLMAINEGAAKTSARTVELAIRADDLTTAVVGVEASNDNVALSAVAGTEPTWTLPAGDGSKTVWVRVTDTAGRTTTQSDQITLDSSLAPVALDRTTVSVTVERGTLHRESVTITPSQTLFEATLELSASLNGVANLLGPSGPFKAMDEVGLYLALDFDVPQTAPVGLQSGTLVLRSSVGETLATVAIDVTVVDPPAGVVPATLSTPSSDRRVIDSGGDMVVVDTVIVGLDDAIPNPNQRILDIAAAHAGIVRGSIPSARMYQLQVPGTATPAELETIRLSVEAEANVTYASATYSLSLSDLAPNDPWQDAWWEEVAVWDENDVGGRNWSMELIKMPSAWALQTGDASVPVAILDAGIEFAHPDLAPNAVTYNTDLGKRNPMTTHGTQVAGIACAKGNNNRGVTGVAWDCSLRGYELGILQGLDMHDVASGMIKAADDGARIVNMSIGSRFHNSNCVVRQKALDESTDILRDAIQTVINNGDDVLWIVAAGNDPCDAAIMTPANLSGEFENVITVASANDAGELSDFSARGSLVTVAAAGGQRGAPNGDGELLVLSTASAGCGIFGCDEDYISDWGTSMAAPQVSGLAALVLSSHPDLTATEIKECIVTAAVSNGPAIVGQTFHVVHAPSAVACAPGVENLVMTNDQWKTLELSWAGGVTNAEPNDWQISGFDDSGWSDAYIPPDPYYSWVDIADADWLSSTGRDTGHLTSETWITRRQFEITHPVTGDATLSWNVDNWASIWINGNVLVTNAGTWTSLISTPVPAAFLHQGTNTIAVKVLQDGNTNSWSVNPTFVQAKLVFP